MFWNSLNRKTKIFGFNGNLAIQIDVPISALMTNTFTMEQHLYCTWKLYVLLAIITVAQKEMIMLPVCMHSHDFFLFLFLMRIQLITHCWSKWVESSSLHNKCQQLADELDLMQQTIIILMMASGQFSLEKMWNCANYA